MKRRLFFLIVIAGLLSPAFGTDITIPSIEIATRIYGAGGQLVVDTDTQMDIVVEGGYKFGGKVVLGFDGYIALQSVEQTLPPVTFKAVSLSAREIFGIPACPYRLRSSANWYLPLFAFV